MPSLSAIFWASSGCERPEKSIKRFEGPRSIQCSGLSSGLVSATSSPGRRVSSVVALSTEIALFRDLLRRETSKRFGRDIFCYVRPACNPCIVPDLYGCLEAIVNAGPDVLADLRLPFWLASLVRIVGGDVAGRDVRVLADLRVAKIGEMGHFRPGADLRVLDLDERARLDPRPELRAGAQVAKRAHGGIASDLGVDDDGVRSHLRTATAPRAPAQHGERMNRGIGLELHLGLDPRGL